MTAVHINASPTTYVADEACTKLDAQSLLEICPDTDQIMVYGWGHCKYGSVITATREMSADVNFPIKAVHTWQAGYPGPLNTENRTLEGRVFNRISYGFPATHLQLNARVSKTGLTNLVLENCMRVRMGLDYIPLVFCIDIDGNPQPYSPETILSKEDKYNNQITHKELRRAYKLSTHVDKPLRWTAIETFKFVKLKRLGQGSYALEQIKAPWDNPDWEKYWMLREARSRSVEKETDSWRAQVNKYLEEDALVEEEQYLDLSAAPDLPDDLLIDSATVPAEAAADTTTETATRESQCVSLV